MSISTSLSYGMYIINKKINKRGIMGKKMLNNLTKKDGNKLGRRKQKMYNNPNIKKGVCNKRVDIDDLDDKLSFMADWIPNEVSIDKMLASFAESLTPVLSMDRGIPAGDFTAMGLTAVGGAEDSHWRSGVHIQMLLSAIKHDHNTLAMCLEEDPNDVIKRVEDMVKDYNQPTMFKPYIHQTESEFYKQIEKYKSEYDKNNDDHHAVWCSPMVDHDLLTLGCSKNNDEVDNTIFLRARTFGKSVVRPNIIYPVKAIK